MYTEHEGERRERKRDKDSESEGECVAVYTKCVCVHTHIFRATYCPVSVLGTGDFARTWCWCIYLLLCIQIGHSMLGPMAPTEGVPAGPSRSSYAETPLPARGFGPTVVPMLVPGEQFAIEGQKVKTGLHC